MDRNIDAAAAPRAAVAPSRGRGSKLDALIATAGSPRRPSRGGVDRNRDHASSTPLIRVAPLAGAWIETPWSASTSVTNVAPSRGRGSKLGPARAEAASMRSPLSRGRGSKPPAVAEPSAGSGRPSRGGVDRNTARHRETATACVAPLAGAWIETATTRVSSSCRLLVALLAGAWIDAARLCALGASRPPRGGVDRNRPSRSLWWIWWSTSSRVRGSKLPRVTQLELVHGNSSQLRHTPSRTKNRSVSTILMVGMGGRPVPSGWPSIGQIIPATNAAAFGPMSASQCQRHGKRTRGQPDVGSQRLTVVQGSGQTLLSTCRPDAERLHSTTGRAGRGLVPTWSLARLFRSCRPCAVFAILCP